MSIQIFPPEIFDLFLNELASATRDLQSRAALLACTLVNRQFYYQASSYIFSSLTIYTPKRLRGLHTILITNPNIARHIRSFTVRHQTSPLSMVFNRLRHLQEFRWIGWPTPLIYPIVLQAIKHDGLPTIPLLFMLPSRIARSHRGCVRQNRTRDTVRFTFSIIEEVENSGLIVK
ncbi:hypothetical protein BYT27DRAFT_6480081 [Phlegmacium glaucopus]|nr:hypothetical protein BYT27DRAFT_6480081 [Phlegmacium glaucopus]